MDTYVSVQPSGFPWIRSPANYVALPLGSASNHWREEVGETRSASYRYFLFAITYARQIQGFLPIELKSLDLRQAQGLYQGILGIFLAVHPGDLFYTSSCQIKNHFHLLVADSPLQFGQETDFLREQFGDIGGFDEEIDVRIGCAPLLGDAAARGRKSGYDARHPKKNRALDGLPGRRPKHSESSRLLQGSLQTQRRPAGAHGSEEHEERDMPLKPIVDESQLFPRRQTFVIRSRPSGTTSPEKLAFIRAGNPLRPRRRKDGPAGKDTVQFSGGLGSIYY